MFLNAARAGCRQFTNMSQPSIIAQRLLAHARICRDIAAATANAETAGELERMALACVAAATPIPSRNGKGSTAPPRSAGRPPDTIYF